MKYPDFLHTHGTIALVAPSFGCNTEPYKSLLNAARKKFKTMGYHLRIGPNCYLGKGIGISSTPKRCAQELRTAYISSKNDIILSVGGGELMCEILDEIDFERIRESAPKWYMGFSDNTNFTFLLTTLCDVASVYGPNASSFGMDPWHASLHDAFALLQGRKLSFDSYGMWEKESLQNAEHPLAPYNLTEREKLTLVNTHAGFLSMKGRLLGGCMDCLENLIGTEYDHVTAFQKAYSEDGIIWFLESCDLNVLSIRRTLWHMEHAGWFKHTRGFLIGRPANGNSLCGLDHIHAVTDVLSKYHVPILLDADLGHMPPSVPLICGSYADIKAHKNHWAIDMYLE